MLSNWFIPVWLAGIVAASPVIERAAAPTVKLDSATVTGVSAGKSDKFLGIPFAKPPVGDLRFRLPQPIPAYTGSISAKEFGLSCPQQAVDLPLSGLVDEAVDYIVNSIFGLVFPNGEDCLTLNVVKPASAKPGDKLPVVVWIFGGGFELGSTSMYNGATVVDRSISLGKPVVYVSMNYRVSGFGFMPGKEIKDAGVGNIGLHDQREALRWVQKYISNFGGDPTKVTIWGESAGAISVALHMLTNNGNTEGLFRAGFMQSGAPIPVGDITNGQKYYDAVVQGTKCSGAADTLDCLRKVDYATLKKAIDATPGIFSYQSLMLAYLPRVDGVFLKDNPQYLVQQGSVARIPIVNGNCDDEGTLFSLVSLNVTTDAGVKSYLQTQYLSRATDEEIANLMKLYPSDTRAGSPFDTGILNALTPQFKRLAAIQGDAVFIGPRRYFLQQIASKQDVWSYTNKRFKALPVLGSAHATDILNVYGPDDMTDYLIYFAATLNPNGPWDWPYWNKYTPSSPNLLVFQDDLIFPRTTAKDDHRKDAIDYLTKLTLSNPI